MIFNLIKSAKELLYNNKNSGLSAKDTQDAIDEINNNLTVPKLLASYGGFEVYKSADGAIMYKSNFSTDVNMTANATTLVNNTTWKCDITIPLVLPCRVINKSNSTQVCMGFWIVMANALYFIPLANTTMATVIIGSNMSM